MKNKNSRQKKSKKAGDDIGELCTKYELSRAQVEEYKHAFDLFDKDGNGTISKEELSKCISEVFGEDESISVETILDALDANKDSQVDLDEFIRAMTYEPYKTEGADANEEEMKKVYPLFINGKEGDPLTGKCKEVDDENDEHISEEEIKKIAEYLGDKDIRDEDIKDMIRMAKECAEGSDEKVNFEQFKGVIYKKWD